MPVKIFAKNIMSIIKLMKYFIYLFQTKKVQVYLESKNIEVTDTKSEVTLLNNFF